MKLSWRRPKVFATVVFIVLIAVLGGMWWSTSRSRRTVPSIAEAPAARTTSVATVPSTIRMIAAGDFIAHDAINKSARRDNGTYDYLQFMSAMEPFFSKADIRFCNQAVPSGGPAYGISGYPVFNTPLEMIHDMKSLGCNVINTGTNHTFDKGLPVIKTMLDEWDKPPAVLAIAGANRTAAEQNAVRYFTVKNVTFAFLSYTTYTNSTITDEFAVNMYSDSFVRAQMAEARTKADVVLVSMRWGTEYSSAINSAQHLYAQKLADMGADIIIGHGPHVLQPVQQLTGKDGRPTLVWYSIGNFLHAQLPIESLTGCLAVINISPTLKKVTDVGCMPIYMHYEWTAEQKAKDQLMGRTNFALVPLDTAQNLIARSQNNTTVDAQNKRIKDVLNTFMNVPLISTTAF